ncbi:MAG: transglycosylase SLT domain-containing protein [Bdellovibrionales bacterium]
MTNSIGTWLLYCQILLLVVAILSFLINKSKLLPAGENVKIHYLLLALIPLLSGISLWAPAENPIGFLPKNQISIASFSVKSELSNFRLTETIEKTVESKAAIGPQSILLVGLIISLFFTLLKLTRDVFRLKKIKLNSILFRRTKRTELRFSDEIKSPLSFFNGRYVTLIPSESIENSEQLKIGIQHEFTHHRYGDTLLVWPLELFRIIFLLNPLYSYVLNNLEQLQESRCDSRVIEKYKVNLKTYCKVLMDFANQSPIKNPKYSFGFFKNEDQLKRRVHTMFHGRKIASKKTFICSILFAIISLTGTAWAIQGSLGAEPLVSQKFTKMVKHINTRLEIKIADEPEVLSYVNQWTNTAAKRKYLKQALARMDKHKSMIEQKLKENQLPKELLAIPLMESGYKNVVSPSGAKGIWQFIPQTARKCGLRVNNKIDDRNDPNKLTDAATCYYKKLHQAFQDWNVAITAYNLGEHGTLRAITKNSSNDIFELGRKNALPKESANYLPKVMATIFILENRHML